MSNLLRSLSARATSPLSCLSLPEPVDVSCEIWNYQILGSYSWLDTDRQTPTIAIPGQPRIWQDPSLPLQLSPDRGYTFIDQNAWRCRASPLEPIFRSIEVTQQLIGNTSFSLSEQQVDIVTDRNNLRKLSAMVRSMRFNANPGPSKNREFRIDAQLAPNGRTLLLTRYSNKPRQMINQSNTGYGANFERATTASPAPISIPNQAQAGSKNFSPTSYHRIAKYSLAALNLIVRYEVDAALGAPLVDNLYASTSMSPSPERNLEIHPHSTLRHFISGSLVSQERIMELKTSGSNGRLVWNKIRPQLYFSQTPILKVGSHQKGTFSKIEDYSIDQNYNGPAVEDQTFVDNLRFLVPVLEQMRNACQQHGKSGEPLAFFWSGAGPLQLYEIEHPIQARMLPRDVLESL
ncbi:unnamed protein product [Rhizoctonia solani]|uniref:Uncharacterized protein n=1 Tax=Rhizoctonia solani TaxID=456999 RepID=A0A8H2XCF0_9AGAM|nr:unnamed protein product [Rhizoctonia solani]